ncbi:MAG: glycosyltransferase family 4 protein [Clostridia bacterium]|nr:glycosyltransferase family 4 protein [Clostridia bacterium]
MSKKLKIVFFAGKTSAIINFNSELIKNIVDNGHEVICLGPEDDCKEKIEKLGAKYAKIQLNRNSTNPLVVLNVIKRLKKYFRDNKFDLYYGFTTVPATYGSIAAKLAGIKNIYVAITGAGKIVLPKKGIFEKFVRLVLICLYKISLSGCKKVFFLNNQNMEFFLKHKIAKQTQAVRVGGSGVNLEKFTPKPLGDRNSFLFVGSLLKLKGIMEYMEAARMVKKKYPDAEFHIVGEIDERLSAISQDELNTYVCDGTVIYHGYQTDVRPYFAQCSCFVLPSYTEGIPTCVIEAMATQRPIITTHAPGCSETIVDGEDGFLVPVGDAEALADKMIYMIEHRKDAEKMALSALERVKQNFDVRKVNEKMIKTMSLD